MNNFIGILITAAVIEITISHTLIRFYKLALKSNELDDSSSVKNLTSNFSTKAQSNNIPKIALLISFPNSGSSYTTELIRTITKTTTATNYNLQNENRSHLFPNIENNISPYLLTKMPLPPKYILTKSHCTLPRKENIFHYNVTNFKRGCTHVPKVGFYDFDKISKIIHLIRDPFDNIVSRFHLQWKTNKKLDNSKEGFRQWCLDYDKNSLPRKFRQVLLEHMTSEDTKVLCHAEFFRYINWHNNAFQLRSNLSSLKTMILHYSSYHSNYDETVQSLVQELQLESVVSRAAKPPTFRMKHYEDYFTTQEKQDILDLIRRFATNETWSHLEPFYF